MSDKTVTKFEPATYVEKLRDRMKQTMIDVVPDDQWDAMIKAELEGFFQDRSERNQCGGETRKPSAFKQAVGGIIEEECKRRVREMLQSEEWSGFWDGQKQQAGVQIKELVRQHGAEIMSKWIEGAVAQAVQNIQYQR